MSIFISDTQRCSCVDGKKWIAGTSSENDNTAFPYDVQHVGEYRAHRPRWSAKLTEREQEHLTVRAHSAWPEHSWWLYAHIIASCAFHTGTAPDTPRKMFPPQWQANLDIIGNHIFDFAGDTKHHFSQCHSSAAHEDSPEILARRAYNYMSS